MVGAVLRRLLQSTLVLLVVSFISFLVFRFVGDPVTGLLGQDSSQADRLSIRRALGLDDNFAVQFARFVDHGIHGDFGLSYRLQEPVLPLVLSRLPATLELVLLSAVIAIVLGFAIGCYCAAHPNRVSAKLVLAASLIGISLPTFVLGLALIYIFSVELRWLPSSGRSVTEFAGYKTSLLSSSGWRSIILPAFALALFQISTISRLVRSEMLSVMQSEYIRFARARGLSESRIFVNALRNILVPTINIVAVNIGGLIAYSVVTETIFQWPGMGFLFIQSVDFADIPVLSTYLVLISCIFLLLNLVADLLSMIIDPRLRLVR